jgi:hypothetical protein
MFKIFNPDTKKVELVAKIDYKKHYHVSGVPFEREEPEIEEEPVIEEIIANATPKKKGRPFNK